MSRHDIDAEITIEATPKRVFDVATDIHRVGDWLPNVTQAKMIGAKKGLGAHREVHLKFHNSDIVSKQEITQYEPAQRFGWLHTEDLVDGKPFNMLEDIGTDLRFSATGKSTRVHAKAHFKPKGLKARLAVPLINHDIKKQVHAALENLKRICEET